MNSESSTEFKQAMVTFTVLSVVNLVASLSTLWLIIALKKINGYMKMIIAMTLAQSAFDGSLVIFNTDVLFFQYTQLFLGAFCGTATGIWSLVLVSVMVYIVISKRYFDVSARFWLLCACVTGFSLALGLALLITFIHKMPSFTPIFAAFNTIRVLIIGLTAAAILLAAWQLRDVFDAKNPVRILAKRLCL